jgi:hypothetical protein
LAVAVDNAEEGIRLEDHDEDALLLLLMVIIVAGIDCRLGQLRSRKSLHSIGGISEGEMRPPCRTQDHAIAVYC